MRSKLDSCPLDITLYRGFPEKSVYTWSPFVTKLEFRLRLSDIKYQVAAGNPKKGPTGKIPYVDIKERDELDAGTTSIGDSSLIVKHFIEEGLIESMDTQMNAIDKGQDLALQALVEDRLNFFNMRERWIDNYYTQRDKALGSLPYLVRVVVGLIIYRNCNQTLHGQGIGRYSAEETKRLREAIWTRIDGLLEEQRKKVSLDSCFWCLGGDKPTECDTSLFGFINSALLVTSAPESKSFVQGLSATVDYATRIHEKYFPDYDKW